MRYVPVSKGFWLALAAAFSAQCAAATTLPLDRPVDRPATGQLADVRLEKGTECILRLMTGDTVRGSLERIGNDRIDLRLPRMPSEATSSTAFATRTSHSWPRS